MNGKIIQIAIANENNQLRAALWVLTDQGEVYFMVLSEGRWYRQELPQGKVKEQYIASQEIAASPLGSES